MQKEIGIAVRDVLKLEPFAGAKLLAGKGGLKRVVTSVNVMEVPDIVDWVSPGELLVTTAYSVRNNVDALSDVIPRLNEVGVVGLGIKSKRYIGKVPDRLIEIADLLAFPVFEIPPQVAFPEIITTVMTNIVNKQTKVLQEIQQLNLSLTTAMLEGGNLQEISHILYQRFGNSVAISSDYFSSFVVNTTDEKRDQIYRVIEEDKKAQMSGEPQTVSKQARRVRDTIRGEPCIRLIVPIYNDKTLYGNIYMWEDNRAISSVEQAVIESITSLIALDIMKKMSMLEMENNNRSSFLEDLLSSDRRSHQKAMNSARYFDYDVRAAHQVVVIHLRKTGERTLAGNVLYRLNTGIVDILQRLVKSTPFKIIFANHYNNIVLVCEESAAGPAAHKQAVTAFAQKLDAQLRAKGLGDLIVMGIGRCCGQSGELYRSFAEAKRAASCPHLGGSAGYVFYEDMGVYRLLSYEGFRNERERFAEEMLGSLLRYDEDKDSELVKTLSTYFRCRGNLTRLSEEMGVHYNTIVYRLQRIRELSGMSLDNDRDLLNFQIALKIQEMKGED